MAGKKDSTLKLYSFHSSGNKVDSFLIDFKGAAIPSKYYNESWVRNLFVSENEKFVFLNAHNFICIFKKAKSNKYFLYKIIKTTFFYENIKQIDADRFLFSFIYNSHPLDQKEKVVLSVYNIKNDTVSYSIFPQYERIEFSHLIHHWIAVVDSKVLLTSTIDYKIRVYDLRLSLVDSFTRNIPDWIRYDTSNSASFNFQQLKSNIENLFQIDQGLYRIEKVIPYRKNNLIVSYKTGKNKDIRCFDILSVSHKGMRLVDSNIKISTIELSNTYDSITIQNRPFPELLYSNETYSNKNYFYIVSPNFCPYHMNKIYSDIEKECEEYIESHPPTWGISVFTLTK